MTNPKKKSLTAKELARVNEVSAHKASRVAAKIEAALILSADRDKVARTKARLCRSCFYTGPNFAGQAFTSWSCLLCQATAKNSNTDTPTLCLECSESFHLCSKCGGDFEMKPRSKFTSRAGDI